MLIGMPSTRANRGPKIFLRRLKQSWRSDPGIKVSHNINPFNNINLFSGFARNYFCTKYVMRIDGVFMHVDQLTQTQKEVMDKMKESVSSANGVIFQSEFSKSAYATYVDGNSCKNSLVINNGATINSEKVTYRNSLGIPDKTIILCSSNWRYHKRLSSIVQVVSILNKHTSKFHLVVLGSGANRYLPTDKSWITWHGNITPHLLYRYYKSADVYLHLAYIDNCPNTLVEAIANGLPVVTSNLGGAKELVFNASAGIVADCDNSIDIGKSIDLYSCPEPEYQPIVNAVMTIANNSSYYRNNINYSVVDINVIAAKYKNFLRLCLKGDAVET